MQISGHGDVAAPPKQLAARGESGTRTAGACAPALRPALAAWLLVAVGLLLPSSAIAQLSDDFNDCLPDPGVWSFVDPVGDSAFTTVGAGTGDAALEITVPAGVDHHPFLSNDSARLMQAVADDDFEVEVKFDSVPSVGYQMEGVIVEETATRYLRFEFYHDGTNLVALVMAIEDGARQTIETFALPDVPRFMRITRSGDSWSVDWAPASGVYQSMASFSRVLAVTGIGPYAGNYGGGSAPAFTASIDYFFATASPIEPEDGASLPSDRTLALDVVGGGSVTIDPDQPSYTCADTVTLTATPDPGFVLESWSGDLTGTTNPVELSMTTSRSVTATFVDPLGPPPVVSDVEVEAGGDAILVRWATDVPATSHVDYGETSAYELGVVEDVALVTQHEILLSSLSPDTDHHLRIRSATSTGAETKSAEIVKRTALDPALVPSGFLSEDFDTCALDTGRWTRLPASGSTSFDVIGGGTGNARLRIQVPAGQPQSTSVPAPRLLQSVNDTDLDVAIDFDSVSFTGIQGQGLVFQESDDHFLRMGLLHDGSTRRAVVGIVEGGSTTFVTFVPSPGSERIRVQRTGDRWQVHVAEAGGGWTPIADFVHALNLTALGPYGAHYITPTMGGGTVQPHTVVVDRIDTLLSPIVPEDAGARDGGTLETSVVGLGSVDVQPQASAYACSEEVVLTALPDEGQRFVGWSGTVASTVNPLTVQTDQHHQVQAEFEPLPPGPGISGISVSTDAEDGSATVSWSTSEPSSSRVDFGTTSAYELGTVQDPTLVQMHAVVVDGLAPGQTYHYAVTSETALGGTETSGDATFTLPYPNGTHPSGVRSDDFNTCVVDTSVWRVRDALGDGSVSISGAGSGDAKIQLSVPGGVSHNAWISDTALQLLQTANDEDFILEAKFDSVPTQGFQEQGILVKQGDGEFLRFEVYADGTESRVFAAAISGGVGTSLLSQVVTPAPGYRLRVQRQADLWTLFYSPDGATWQAIGSFPYALQVSEVGLHVGNAGGSSAPAHAATIDYFVNSEVGSPPEDGAAIPSSVFLSTTTLGSGSVDVQPASSIYSCGAQVSVAALPDSGQEFAGWSGGIISASPSLEFAIVRDLDLTATFVPDTTPPEITISRVVGGPDGADLWIQTSEPTTLAVPYGSTSAYEIGTATSDPAATFHVVPLTGLPGNQAFHFQVEATDAAGQVASTPDQTAATSIAAGQGPAGLESDDFNACVIDTVRWDVIDPRSDASFEITGAGAGDAKLEIAVPAGSQHYPGTVNSAPRLMQPVANEDMEIEVRFDSRVIEQYQEQGIIIEQDPSTYLRFDFYGDGVDTNVFAAIIDGSGFTSLDTTVVPGAETTYMKVTRTGDTWTQSYSYDGVEWVAANVFDFVMSPTAAGIFAGNQSGSSSPAHTAVFDYFWSTTTPAAPEDLGEVGGAKVLSIDTTGAGSVIADPDQSSYGCGEEVELTAVPDPGQSFDGWSGDLSGQQNPETLLMSEDRSVTGNFIIDTIPPVLSNIEVFRGPDTALVVWQTNEPATSQVSYGETTAYELGSVIDGALVKDHTILVTGLDGGTTYQLRVTSVDGASFATNSDNITSGPAEGPVIRLFDGLDQTFGENGLAQRWANVMGNVSDPDGVASASYSVNGGPEIPLSLGWDRFRLDRPGDFNADVALTALDVGTNTVSIRAADALGNESLSIVNVEFTDAVVPTLPLVVDWSSAGSIQELAQTVDGEWVLEGDRIRNVEMGYDRLVAIGDMSWTSYEAEVHLTLEDVELYFDSPSNGPAVGLITRWKGHVADGEQPARQWWPIGGYAFHRWAEGADGGPPSQFAAMQGYPGPKLDAASSQMTVGSEYVFKMRVETLPDGSTEHRFKKWLASEPEPAQWLLIGTEAPGTDELEGSLLVVAHHVEISIGEVTVTPLSP